MREKLIELIQDADKIFFNECKDKGMLNIRKMYAKYIADYLLANGVIVLPCKVGDTLYHLKDIYKGKKIIDTVIVPIIVDSFVIGDTGRPQANTCDNERNEWIYYDSIDFGRYVFLTRKEAEKALEEMKNE